MMEFVLPKFSLLSSLCSRLGNQKHRNLKTPCIDTLSNHVNAFLGKFVCCIQPQQHQSEHCDNGQSISVCETKQTEHKSCVTTMTKSNPACGVGNDISMQRTFVGSVDMRNMSARFVLQEMTFVVFVQKEDIFK